MTRVKMQRISLLWSTVRERAMAKGFSFNMGDTKYPCVCRRTKLPARGYTVRIKDRDTGRGSARGGIVAEYSLSWPGLVTNQELGGEAAHDHVCVVLIAITILNAHQKAVQRYEHSRRQHESKRKTGH